jgi:tetratricopeptide (TPR) repeat protein
MARNEAATSVTVRASAPADPTIVTGDTALALVVPIAAVRTARRSVDDRSGIVERAIRITPVDSGTDGVIVVARHYPMKIRLWLVTALAVALTSPVFADKRGDAKARVEFGITVAQKGLWTEAVRAWERAVQIDNTYGEAWNNLGIGLEQLGRFDEARKAYERALEIEPGNNFIRNNYDQFREIYDRQNRRRDK